MAARPPRVLRKRPLRFWLVLAGVGLMAFLYYKPFRAYVDTRSAVAERRVEVARLRTETHVLQRRLARSASVQELQRQARELGYVKPGERLYIVKGIAAWRRAHPRATIAGDG
jgi:Septum formation initiator